MTKTGDDLDERATDATSPTGRGYREHPEFRLVGPRRQLSPRRWGRAPGDCSQDMPVVDRDEELCLACPTSRVHELCLVVSVDHPVCTTQQVVGVVGVSCDASCLGILGWLGGSNEEAHADTAQVKAKPVPLLGISNRPLLPMITEPSRRAASRVAPWQTRTKRFRANSG
jgi:hypothetical protein